MPLTAAECLDCVPDDHHSIDLRGMLLSGRCRLFGDSTDGFVACSGSLPFAVAWGSPSAETVRAAVSAAGWEVAEEWHLMVDGAGAEAVAAALPDWPRRGVVLHRWPPERPWPLVEGGTDVRLAPDGWRDAGFTLDHLPAPLARELGDDAIAGRPFAAAFVDGRMASWCYAPVATETLWDVSVDTLEPYRRRRLSSSCFATLAAEMERRGKWPVWGAVDDNTASLSLASRLGFEPASRLHSFVRP